MSAFKIVMLTMLSCLLGFLTGCMNFDYVGQKFEPIPDSQNVDYFVNRNMVPPGKFQIIGRAVVTGPNGIDTFDIQELLLEKARSYGANAVVITGVMRENVGLFERSEESFYRANRDTSPISLGPNGESISIDTLGKSGVPLRGETRSREQIKLQALFLKDRQTVRQLLEARGADSAVLQSQPFFETATSEVPPEAGELFDSAKKESSPERVESESEPEIEL